MHRLLATIVIAGGFGLSSAATAQTVVPGRLLASNCFQCHGTEGRPVAGLEELAGESASSLYEEMLELRSDREPGIMNAHARGYTDQQLLDLSIYFSRLPH